MVEIRTAMLECIVQRNDGVSCRGHEAMAFAHPGPDAGKRKRERSLEACG